MMVYSMQDKMLPLNRPILVYLPYNKEPKWEIDEFFISAASDGRVVTGFGNYLHSVSHWCELPEVPTLG